MKTFPMAILIALQSMLTVNAAEPSLPPIVRIEGFHAPVQEGAPKPEPVNQCLGFIVEKEGFLLTVYQNLTDPASGRLLEEFQVSTTGSDPKTHNASIIGVDPTLNLGILKLESEEEFPVASRAPEGAVKTGTNLSAVGGFVEGKPSLVHGSVSGLNTRQCYQESLASTMFRAKIHIPMENVGGPVFFSDTGVVTAIYTGFKPKAEPGHEEEAGETHLLPIGLCFNIYDSIKQKRSLKSPWTGFSVRALAAEEQRFFPTAKKHNGGIAIEHVWPNSPAEKLGIKVGDILVQLGYNRIMSVADFQRWLYMYGVGQQVKLVILRNGTDYMMTDYVIEERPAWAKPK